MLTQGLAPDPKCELNITSFLTLPQPLHCPGVVHLCYGLGGGQGVGIIYFIFFVLFLCCC